MTQKFNLLLLFILQAAIHVNQMPISIPGDNYPDIMGRLPNSHYNRLPQNRITVQTDPLTEDNSVTDEYDDYDEQTSNKPITNAQYASSSNNNYNPLLVEYIKHKRRRRKKIRRPCIPIQSFHSPLFSRYKREIEGQDTGKTFGLFGNRYPYGYPHQPIYGIPFYGTYGGAPNRPHHDNIRPHYDNVKPQHDSPLYNPVGGYPCVPVSYGHVPFTGPFGFFGQGGLFDTGASPSIHVPQTVVINRPPLFGNKPSFGNRPQYGNRPPYGENEEEGVSSENRPPGFFGSVVDKLTEFVTSVSPQAVYSAIGDTLQGIGNAIANNQPAATAVDTIRNGYREFSSLIFR